MRPSRFIIVRSSGLPVRWCGTLRWLLAVARDSNFTIETDTEGIDNEGLTISEDIAPSKRAKRWKVGRGGSVFILNTGDGRVVIRPR